MKFFSFTDSQTVHSSSCRCCSSSAALRCCTPCKEDSTRTFSCLSPSVGSPWWACRVLAPCRPCCHWHSSRADYCEYLRCANFHRDCVFLDSSRAVRTCMAQFWSLDCCDVSFQGSLDRRRVSLFAPSLRRRRWRSQSWSSDGQSDRSAVNGHPWVLAAHSHCRLVC